jgi:conjugal transfer pilus assembly protein TraB
MIESTRHILKKQKLLFGALAISALIIVSCVGMLIFSNDTPRPLVQKKSIDLPGDKISPQDIWMTRMEADKQLNDQKFKYLEDLIVEAKQRDEANLQEKRLLKKEINDLTLGLRLAKSQPSVAAAAADPFGKMPSVPYVDKSPLIEMSMQEPKTKLSHVDLAIPAGTSVKALLVSAVDAPSGVYSASDPIPIKLRLLDNAKLPKEVRVKLIGGIIIGSAYGNLSSERVYMRLERLTQVKAGGSFIETDITGYVSGEDGKYGVRGVVVDKSTKAVANAAASGFFGELGQILQSAVSKKGNSYQLDAISSRNDVLTQGAIGGGTSAFDMIADYYLKRAEHIQPVIQVNAGRVVDVTFTHGVNVGDLHTKDRVRKTRENARKEI